MTMSSGSHPKWLTDSLRHFNRRVTNPLIMTYPGRNGHTFAEHGGRRLGKLFATPVLAMPLGGAIVIPPPYGECADWCQNVLAAGGCCLKWKGGRIKALELRLTAATRALCAFTR